MQMFLFDLCGSMCPTVSQLVVLLPVFSCSPDVLFMKARGQRSSVQLRNWNSGCSKKGDERRELRQRWGRVWWDWAKLEKERKRNEIRKWRLMTRRSFGSRLRRSHSIQQAIHQEGFKGKTQTKSEPVYFRLMRCNGLTKCICFLTSKTSSAVSSRWNLHDGCISFFDLNSIESP